MDQGRLEELKRLLQKRHQEPKLGLEQNFNGKNFKISNSETKNSDPDALNLEAEADQNSAYENNAEPQNFISDDNGSLRQNSKARDYDKDPIIIKRLCFLRLYEIFHDCYAYRMLILHLGRYRSKPH